MVTRAFYLRVVEDAPIMPGESAAGFQLGHDLEEYGSAEGEYGSAEGLAFNEEARTESSVLHSKIADLWVQDSVITQIGVHGSYRGALSNCIRIGDTIGKVRDELGCVGEDDEDNLVLARTPGLSFEVPAEIHARYEPQSYSKRWLKTIQDARICSIFVFSTLCACGTDLRNRQDECRCPGCGSIVFKPLYRQQREDRKT